MQLFSVVSLWGLMIKIEPGSAVIRGDVRRLRRGLLDGRLVELAVPADHAFAVGNLPRIHADPFDRLLTARAHAEGLTLLTADAVVARCPGAIRKV